MAKNTEKFYELDGNLGYQIDYTANFNRSFRRKFQNRYINSELTPDEFTILYIINLVPEISQSEIANILFKGKAHVGKILNDMELRGLLKRIADTNDNILIKRNEITPKGTQILEEGHKKFSQVLQSINQEFTEEEIKQFIYFLKKFRSVLKTLVDVKLK